MTVVEIARALRELGVPADKVREAVAADRASSMFSREPTVAALAALAADKSVRQLASADGVAASGRRVCDRLELTIGGPPRTKKNGTTLGIKQSPAYRRYRDGIIAALAPLLDALWLPLPDGRYNIAAVYYVDRRGEQADKVGLDQGLYDALENAGVVTNDWQFRTADGTRIVFGDPYPRVELTITPLESSNA